jgi:hypothetical protein
MFGAIDAKRVRRARGGSGRRNITKERHEQRMRHRKR